MFKKSVPYEILIRYDENGDFKAAHVQMMTIIFEDDKKTIIARSLESVKPLTEDSEPAFADALGKAAADALASAMAVAKDRDEWKHAADEAKRRGDELELKNTQVTEQIAALQGRHASLVTAVMAAAKAHAD